ncbi:hypothetical protein EON65_55865 [archaeon]|nr:MAG: hypothetical protein EON65_55865 [archaeon]
MFKIDTKEVDNFTLPKRMGTSTLLNIESKKRTQSKVSKLRETTKAAEEIPEHEFSFLPTVMGHDNVRAKSPGLGERSSPTPNLELAKTINKNSDGKSSDVDEVSVIMAGIQTSDDAINFFARFGSGELFA